MRTGEERFADLPKAEQHLVRRVRQFHNQGITLVKEGNPITLAWVAGYVAALDESFCGIRVANYVRRVSHFLYERSLKLAYRYDISRPNGFSMKRSCPVS